MHQLLTARFAFAQSRQRLSTCYVFSTSTSSSSYLPTDKNPLSYFPSTDIPKETGFWTLPPPQTSQMEDSYNFIDPWEEIYDKTDENDYLINKNYNDTIFDYIPNYSTTQVENYYTERNSHPSEEFGNNYGNNHFSSQQMCDRLDVFKYPERQENLKNENNIHNYNFIENRVKTNYCQPHFEEHILNENRIERTDDCHYNLQRKEEPPKVLSHENDINSQNNQQQEKQRPIPQTHHVPLHKQNSSPTTHPLLDQKHFPPDNESIIANEEDTANNLNEEEAGLAGALSAVKLGAPRSEEENALQEHLRRQGWEEGNIDYMGRDSFDNIWKKISETLASGTSPSQPPEPTTVQAPVTETVQSSAIQETTAAPPSVPSTLPTSEITPQPETVPTAPITQLQEKPIESVPTPISEPPKTESSEKVAKTEQIPTTVPTTPVAAQPTPQPDLKTTETPQEKPSEVLLTSNEQKPLEELKVTAIAPTSPPSDPTKVEPAFIPPEPLKTDIKPAESAAEQKPVTPSMPSSKPEVPQQVESAKTDVVAPKVDTTPQPIFSPPTPSAPEATSPTTAAVPTPASPQTVSPPQATTPTPQTKQEHPPSQASSTPSDLKPLESGKTTSITEAPKEIATGKSDLTPPPSPGQVPVAVPEPKQTPPTPSTPTVTSPTPPASPAAVPPELPTAASKLKVQPETPPTPPVPQSAAQPTLPGSTGDEPPVPPKRKGGKGGSGATAAPAAAQAESASKPQQPKGGKGGKGKK